MCRGRGARHRGSGDAESEVLTGSVNQSDLESAAARRTFQFGQHAPDHVLELSPSTRVTRFAWPIPVGYRHFRSSASSFLGVFTRVPFATLPILLAWLFASGNVLYGALAGLVYGATRALSIYSSASSQGTDDLVRLNQHLMRLASAGHQVAGLLLAVFAAYLLIAPNLP